MFGPHTVTFLRYRRGLIALFCRYRTKIASVTDGNWGSASEEIGKASREPAGWIDGEGIRNFVCDFPVLTELWGGHDNDVQLQRLVR